MSSHGVPRAPRTRSEDQKRQDGERIKKYRELEDSIRRSTGYGPDVFQLTTRLLKLNPEYYTVWNVRRRCLISSFLSGSPSGPSSLAASSSSPLPATSTLSSAASLLSYSAAIPPSQASTWPTSAVSFEGPEGSEDSGGRPEETRQPQDQTKEQQQTDSERITYELQFTIPLLLEFPKCYWIWSYRLWILQQAVQRLDERTAQRIWEDELALDSKMLTKDRRNFHAWGYRRQVVEQLERFGPASVDEGAAATEAAATAAAAAEMAQPGTRSLVEAEFAYTTKMVHVDLSNFSAWHNRSKLIPRLLDERQAGAIARKEFLDSELGLVREALNVGPEDQSLWFYHQFLMMNLTEHVGRPTITPQFSFEERMTYAVREIDNVKDLLLDYDDVKWIYEALLEYTIAVAKMNERALVEEEVDEVTVWLAKLRELDPLRTGLWDDTELEYIRGRRPSYAQES